MIKTKKASHPWHDENLIYTRWGKNNMRLLFIVGVILGFCLGIRSYQLFITIGN